MSKFKDQTDDTPQSSSGESTGESGLLLPQSAKKDNTQTYMQSTKKPSLNTSRSDNTALTTPDNTPTTEKIHLHAMMAKAALTILLNAGLIKRYEVRSQVEPGSTTPPKVLRIRYEFDLSLWTDELELK